MSNYFPSDYEEFIYKSRYARWLEGEGRRENWSETVQRLLDYINNTTPLEKGELESIRTAIETFQVMPSMRALMSAGKSLERDNTCAYNCAYLPIDDPKAFDEAMHILMCGTGVGFSVERQYISKLPVVPDQLFESETTVVVSDSKEGWAKALRQVLALLWSGEIPKWDLRKVRPNGARLKTFGGRASGPEPLNKLFLFAVKLFKENVGRKLSSYDCHSLMCLVADVVVVGGVRRSAMISLSNLSDDKMRHAKSGAWYKPEASPHFSNSNNSACYTEKPKVGEFMREWISLVESGSGERGVFSRLASNKQVKKNGRRDPNYEWGTNPCSEIILRGPKIDEKTDTPIIGTGGQFCNLTEVIVREYDTKEDLHKKIQMATIIGTIQSQWTKFPYLRKQWTKNTSEERLLGVSMTGIKDHPLLSHKDRSEEGTAKLIALLEDLRHTAVETNKKWAEKLGIPQSTAITCVKPSGTVSELNNTASGLHERFAPYYIRTVRGDKKDPLTQFMMDQGIPVENCISKPDTTAVFSFPKKSPEGALCAKDVSAIEQLETWLLYQRHFCEHKPSITVYVKDCEWLEVGAFVYKHLDEMSGVAFLPSIDHVYQQAPVQECSQKEYEDAQIQMPLKIDWTKLSEYEKEDTTVASQTLACTGSSCEIVDIAS